MAHTHGLVTQALRTISAVAIAGAMLLAAGCSSQPAADQPAAQQTAAPKVATTGEQGFAESFDQSGKIPAGWQTQGDVSVVSDQPFDGQHALQFSRTMKTLEQPTSATGPAFAVAPGNYQVTGAMRCAMYSPDNSFKCVVAIEFLDASGKVLDRTTVAQMYDKDNWRPFNQQVAAPEGATQARLVSQMDKAHGSYWIDGLAVRRSAATVADLRVHRVLFKTAQLGNLLFPDDSADVDLTVEADKKLPTDAQTVTYVVTDYWGAEQIKARTVSLKSVGTDSGGRFIYTATLSMDKVPLETGRYYEVHVSIPEPADLTHQDKTTLAILPEAVTHKYTWQQIPFSSRNWDNRISEYVHLTNRLGIRLVGVWGGWNTTPPYQLPGINYDLAQKLNMGVLISSPAHAIEAHRGNYKAYTPQVLHDGAIAQVKKYGPSPKIAITTGNEPPDTAERAAEAVEAYKYLYQGYKEADPDLLVVGTSVGPSENYFKAGMGKYCDVYDYHTYNDPAGIRKTFERYHELIQKYGHPHPIWSTETGLNSQGVERRAVAGDMIRKFTTFFACGGANISWFGLLYPDPQGKITGSAEDAHNVFNCKYKCYSPKMDAISYYNMVNAICIKKFVEEKMYDNIYAALFRDVDGKCLLVLWTDTDSSDVFVPLAGAGEVKQILIDGQIRSLDAAGKGVTVRVTDNPMLLEFAGLKGDLPAALGKPAIKLEKAPEGLVKGQTSQIVFKVTGNADDVQLVAPAFWTVKQTSNTAKGDGVSLVSFDVQAPAQSAARAGVFHAMLKTGGKTTGELTFIQKVQSSLTARLLPRPITGDKAAVRIEVANHSGQPQAIKWSLSLGDAFPMTEGKQQLGKPVKPGAYFAAAAHGNAKVPANGSIDIDVPLANIDPLTSYTIDGRVLDPQGRPIEMQRVMGGFIGAARVSKPLKIDGKLDDAAWKNATVIHIDRPEQFFTWGKENRPTWDGPKDNSALVRILWDDQNLYMGFDITDDILDQDEKGGNMWKQDGVQLLIDPGRGEGRPMGKYDYSMGVGTEGPQVWCHLSASPAVTAGSVKNMQYVQVRKDETTGNRTAEVVIPWTRLLPFEPAVGANLGMSIVINEDDKPIRNCYMNWFGDILSKSVKANGDIILTK